MAVCTALRFFELVVVFSLSRAWTMGVSEVCFSKKPLAFSQRGPQNFSSAFALKASLNASISCGVGMVLWIFAGYRVDGARVDGADCELTTGLTLQVRDSWYSGPQMACVVTRRRPGLNMELNYEFAGFSVDYQLIREISSHLTFFQPAAKCAKLVRKTQCGYREDQRREKQ
jgi:hypothetical protein